MWSFFSRDPTKDFYYEIGESIPTNPERLFWKLHKGKKKGTTEDVTVFILDGTKSPVSSSETEAARSGVKRLKTLRHPTILTFVDSVESEKATYLATEYVIPLEKSLENRENIHHDLSVSWGLFQITRGVSFLVNDGHLKHNNVQLGSIFVNAAGEWKLGGLEFVASSDALSSSPRIPSSIGHLDPPEVRSGTRAGITKCSADAWGLGILIWEVFNGPLLQITSLTNPGKIPKSLHTIFLELTHSNPSSRPNPADVIVRGRRPGGFFKNDLVDSLLFLEEIQIKEQNDKTKFFNGLATVLDKFPDDICRHKILPQLINAFEFGNAGSAVLAPMFKLGKLLDEAEYQFKIVPCIVKLFASTDRATRVRLLQQLEHIADHLFPTTVNDKIFPNIVSGFMDTNPTVREQTVKAMLYLAPKLNANNLNVELLKHFARLQIKDEQGGIRTNTTICLGKISCYLSPQTRRKVLIPAFTRVFQDTFPQAKTAGILALAATQQYYLLSEMSTRILPALCSLTSDADKGVRDTAFRTIKGFLGKLEKVSEDYSLKEKFEAEIDTSTPSVVDAASTWAGWAVSALTSKFHRSHSQQSSLGQISGSVATGNSRPKGTTRYPLGHSSSSTSTTTSSIPSTPSDILQPQIEGQESATDYDDEWDNEDWGSMEDTSNNTSKTPRIDSKEIGSSGLAQKNDGWDNWAIHEEIENEQDNWSDACSSQNVDSKIKPRLSVGDSSGVGDSDWSHSASNKTNDEFFSSMGGTSTTSNSKLNSKTEVKDNWDNQDWDTPGSDTVLTATSRNDDLKKRREERKLQRQKEMETKRSQKAGPMKLGTKKNVEL